MNLYEILGVSPDDPDPKIKARYRLLALTTHPDVTSNGDPSVFDQYAQAYKILGNPKKRRRYNDQYGIKVRPRPLKRGHDLHQRLIISREAALVGGIFPLIFWRYEPCSLCWLSGCSRCKGQGLIPSEVTVEVHVPVETHRSMTVFVEGYGGVSEPGGQRGDLLVHVTILDNE